MQRQELQIIEVSKRYGKSVALKDVTLTFKTSEVALILGSNGAGKSTLLRVLSGFSRPDAGKVTKSHASLSWCGAFLYGALKVRENLSLFSSFSNTASRLTPIIEALSLGTVLEKSVNDLSRGFLQRTSLARAFISNAPYVLLDEPTSFLDDKSASRLCDLIVEDKRTFIIATHDISRLKNIATRVVVLSEGEVVVDSDQTNDKDAAFNTFISGLR